MLSTLCQLAPHQMQVRGLARLGLSKGLPASWPSPFVCHDAFIRAQSHLLAVLRGAGLAPEERCLSPAPPRGVSWQPYLRAETVPLLWGVPAALALLS